MQSNRSRPLTKTGTAMPPFIQTTDLRTMGKRQTMSISSYSTLKGIRRVLKAPHTETERMDSLLNKQIWDPLQFDCQMSQNNYSLLYYDQQRYKSTRWRAYTQGIPGIGKSDNNLPATPPRVTGPLGLARPVHDITDVTHRDESQEVAALDDWVLLWLPFLDATKSVW